MPSEEKPQAQPASDASRRERVQRMEALGLLAGEIAHELNNLLMVISASADMLQEQVGTREEHIAAIRKAARRAATITQEILSFDRKHVLNLRVLDVRVALEHAAAAARGELPPNVSLKADIAKEPLWIRADESKIGQIIRNLVLHERDTTVPSGTLAISARRSTVKADEREGMPAGNYVRISVRGGRTVSPEELAHVFDPFYAAGLRGGQKALGLGTVYGAVKQLGGWIWAEPVTGEGTTFEIFLPEESAPAATQAARTTSGSMRGTETVLVVDDQAAVRAVAIDFLKSQGYNVLQASSGQQALDVASTFEGPIHVLVSDVQMPGMQGPELARRLRESRPDLKTIFFSGYAAEESGVGSDIAAGARFLSKPISLAALGSELRSVLK